MTTPIAFFGGNLGGGEMILLFLIALILFGAKNLPKLARNLGRSMEEFRRAAREVKDEVMRADQDVSPPAPPRALPGAEPDAGNKMDAPDYVTGPTEAGEPAVTETGPEPGTVARECGTGEAGSGEGESHAKD